MLTAGEYAQEAAIPSPATTPVSVPVGAGGVVPNSIDRVAPLRVRGALSTVRVAVPRPAA